MPLKERKATEFVDEYDAELMRLAGVKTKKSLYTGAKGVNVTLETDHGDINIYASSRRKGRYFWSNKDDITGQETVPSTSNAQELGEAYLRALAVGGSIS